MSEASARTARDASARGSARRQSSPRRVLATAGIVAAATALALTGTGASYALWSGNATVDASNVTSGSTSLTINGGTDHTLEGLDLRKIGPGQSVITGHPIIVANTGTTPISATVPHITIVSQQNALADHLSLTLAQSATCARGLAGVTGGLATFSTAATPFHLPAGASMPLCIEVTMNADAPVTVQNSAVTFTLNIDAVQVQEP